MLEHNANPNVIIPECNIAPIHYAAGMENEDFADAAMQLMLKCKGTVNFNKTFKQKYSHLSDPQAFLKSYSKFSFQSPWR